MAGRIDLIEMTCPERLAAASIYVSATLLYSVDSFTCFFIHLVVCLDGRLLGKSDRVLY